MCVIYNKRNFLRALSIALAMALVLSVTGVATAAGRTSLSKKKLTLKTGKSTVLKLKNNKKKTSWKVVSGKKRIRITALSKNRVRVWGISKGKAVVQVKAGKKKYRCNITVKGASNNGTGNGSSSATQKKPSSSSPSPSPTPYVEGPSLAGLIGSSADSLQQKFGAPVRIDSAPQGFDNYIYNPNGNYSAYMIVGVEDNEVVSCFTISRGFTYGNYAKEGEDASDLASRGWKIDTGSGATGGKQIYQITLDNETAYAYHDMYGACQIYGIQIISNKLSPMNFFMTCQHDYTPEMCSGTETEIRELTNAFRVYYGLPALKGDSKGDTVARLHSQEMASVPYFAHEGQDGSSPADRMRGAGISFSSSGENIARGQADAACNVNGWIFSEGHRKNLLSKNYEYIGCGIALRKGNIFSDDRMQMFDMMYATQNFWK